MSFSLMRLPYAEDALSPVLSQETVHTHHAKHHAGYVEKLNELIKENNLEDVSLEELIRDQGGAVFNNAGQVYNHEAYWLSMAPGRHEPTPDLKQRLAASFGSFERFREAFVEEGMGHFGSGWAWLVTDDEGHLALESTHDADNPVRRGGKPLLACDLWEHAYYLDYKNERAEYLKHWLQIVDWQRVNESLTIAARGS